MLNKMINPDLSEKKVFLSIFFIFLFFILHSSFLIGIEVGGHLTEDTTWGPENNPYLVTENLYVDDDVTLTILPGTEIKINAAPLTN
ncbi:MAG: hypothetical protein HN952_03060, partial [Candidatus Cloacimonetes bacterium]|nr:hypothetical protein [Candidatus Cloacimonadota bacterium]